MKILQQGKLPQEQLYRATCRNCGTVFEFTFKETKISPDPRDRGLYSIICPLPGCETEIWVNA